MILTRATKELLEMDEELRFKVALIRANIFIREYWEHGRH